MKKNRNGKVDYGVTISARIPSETKRAAKRKAGREGKNLATWLKDLILRELGHAAR